MYPRTDGGIVSAHHGTNHAHPAVMQLDVVRGQGAECGLGERCEVVVKVGEVALRSIQSQRDLWQR